jgi:uncharacterized DUF497 family protein
MIMRRSIAFKIQIHKILLALGITNKNKTITIIFTIRLNNIRIISARPMSKKERRTYDKK